MATETPTADQRVRGYHERTKHGPEGYAAGPARLDWATQPEPFRWWEGAPAVDLPLAAGTVRATWAELWRPGAVPPRPLDETSLAAFLELSLGLAAWKSHGRERWALRVNPSSGNLHPTEGYVVLGEDAGVPQGVHHYLSRDHRLERRCTPGAAATRRLPRAGFLVGLTGIHRREAWKYGERAWRYCLLDAGHAVAALAFAAAALGWRARVLAEPADEDAARLLGLDRAGDFGDAEPEEPEALVWIAVRDADAPPPSATAVAELGRLAAAGEWHGRANRLTAVPGRDWPAIGEAAAAARKPVTVEQAWTAAPLPEPTATACATPVPELVRQRRSAQAYDGLARPSLAALARILDATLPRAGAPFGALPWSPRVHLLLFVHRVGGLPPGLYLLPRRVGAEQELRRLLGGESAWEAAAGLPAHLPLRLLEQGDAQEVARLVSCRQEIAADGAFAAAMLAEYDAALAAGPWWYRRLLLEAGMLGQVLYLEAEAAGLRGTGIGCFFDDVVHAILGVAGEELQDVYHFTVGGTVADRRLVTSGPYEHLAGRRVAAG
ncbi:MAG: nitroreductase family protein [Deltaproteobacteria bacterium]|nr:nitroreductase family protein [Deltaproteobacteria bacterium]